MTVLRGGAGLALLVLLGACSTTRVIPEPGERSAAVPPAPAPTQPLSQDWQDWPATPGDWTYARDAGATVARYGAPGAAPLFWVRCDPSTRAVTVGRSGLAQPGDGSAMLTLRTSYGVLSWPARPTTGGTSAVRSATDSGLDWIVFSRGHFTAELTGAPTLVLPTWAEPARVIEDCRG